jgi:hypothetical protein
MVQQHVAHESTPRTHGCSSALARALAPPRSRLKSAAVSTQHGSSCSTRPTSASTCATRTLFEFIMPCSLSLAFQKPPLARCCDEFVLHPCALTLSNDLKCCRFLICARVSASGCCCECARTIVRVCWPTQAPLREPASTGDWQLRVCRTLVLAAVVVVLACGGGKLGALSYGYALQKWRHSRLFRWCHPWLVLLAPAVVVGLSNHVLFSKVTTLAVRVHAQYLGRSQYICFVTVQLQKLDKLRS